jgi:hypothetical protein
VEKGVNLDLSIKHNRQNIYWKNSDLLTDLANKLCTISERTDRAKYAAEQARELFGLKVKEPIRDIAGLLQFILFNIGC